jgi:peptidoglycan/LPS O-acetylase OafA/YrhL
VTQTAPVPDRSPRVPAGIRDARSYSPELESLRGVACLLVFFFHASGTVASGAARDVDPLRAFVYAGHTGVTLFFVLSAFLLSRPFLEQARGGPRVGWGRFWARRALRILPLYWFIVVVASIWNARAPADLLRGLPYLFFLNSVSSLVDPLEPFSGLWWSLATEWQFYLLLPIASLCLLSRRGRVLGVIGLVVYAALYTLFATHRFAPRNPTAYTDLGFSLFGRASALLAGVAAAWICGRYAGSIRAALQRRPWLRRGGADALLLVLLAGLGQLLSGVSRRGFIAAEVIAPAWHVAEALFWAALVVWVLLAPLRTAPLFSNPLLRGVGVLSYSLYLVHVVILYQILIPFLDIMTRGKPGWTPRAFAGTLAALAVSLAVSFATYRLVERPFLLRKARVGAER